MLLILEQPLIRLIRTKIFSTLKKNLFLALRACFSPGVGFGIFCDAWPQGHPASVGVQAEQKQQQIIYPGGLAGTAWPHSPRGVTAPAGEPQVCRAAVREGDKAGWGGTGTRLTLGQRAVESGGAEERWAAAASWERRAQHPQLSSRGLYLLLARPHSWVCLSSMFWMWSLTSFYLVFDDIQESWWFLKADLVS